MALTGFLWVGDSITEGFGDNLPVSCYGLPTRFQYDAVIQNPVIHQHYNLGCSGSMVPQYIDIAKQWIEATPGVITAVVCSVWSPNIPQGQEFSWAFDPVNLNAMFDAVVAFEAYCLENSMVFMPVFLAGSPLGQNEVTRVQLQAHLDRCIARWPWLIDFNAPIQNPAYTDGPWILLPDYSTDATHPNNAGYSKQYADRASYFIPAYNQAIAYYGFAAE